MENYRLVLKNDYRKLLTEEENILVQSIKNKSLAPQLAKRKDLKKVTIQMLKLRAATNKKMKVGRKYIPLSRTAKTALSNGHVCELFG